MSIKNIFRETEKITKPPKRGSKENQILELPYITVDIDEKDKTFILTVSLGAKKYVLENITPADAKTMIRGLSGALDYFNFTNNQK